MHHCSFCSRHTYTHTRFPAPRWCAGMFVRYILPRQDTGRFPTMVVGRDGNRQTRLAEGCPSCRSCCLPIHLSRRAWGTFFHDDDDVKRFQFLNVVRQGRVTRKQKCDLVCVSASIGKLAVSGKVDVSLLFWLW